PPLCWITNAFDRSPAELLWIDSPAWAELQGSLLNLSYGYGKLYLVLHESVDGIRQGGMIELPIPSFPTGVMRGRFHPQTPSLIVCGMFSWAGNATAPGGLYRLKKTARTTTLPLELHATTEGLKLQFAQPLSRPSISPERIRVEVWGLKRSAKYGSEHIDPHPLTIRATELSDDGRTLLLRIEDLKPTWGMQIQYELQTADGQPIKGTIHNTIHRLGE
ncbi:MAG: heme-binding protein, partial [Pirellula sp.]